MDGIASIQSKRKSNPGSCWILASCSAKSAVVVNWFCNIIAWFWVLSKLYINLWKQKWVCTKIKLQLGESRNAPLVEWKPGRTISLSNTTHLCILSDCWHLYPCITWRSRACQRIAGLLRKPCCSLSTSLSFSLWLCNACLAKHHH